ncbi:MAG TPA: hypothetical protein IAA76_00255 [Candidatus Ornithospirochaeta stercorigallinarum]|nr:hypothetical protein [Candidatus Ornithospirochaeta stercorigallinarum]
MKHLLIVTTVLASLLLPSCTPPANEETEIENGIKWQEITTDTITLKDLDPDSIYSIQIKDNGSRNMALESESSALHPTKVGTSLFSSKDGTFSFSLKDIGATIGDEYHISRLGGKYADMKIDVKEDNYIPYWKNGKYGKLYEEFYVIDTEELKKDLDISNIVISDSNVGGGEKHTDYGFILNLKEFNLSQNAKSYAVTDLTKYDQVGIYNSLFLIDSTNGNVTKEVRLVNPVTLKLNKTEEIGDKNMVFRVDVNSLEGGKEYVLKVTPLEGMQRNNYAIATGNPNPRYADSGMRRPYLFPINNSDDSILIYIGTIEETEGDFIFNFNVNVNNTFSRYGSVEIVPLTDDMKKPETITLENNKGVLEEFYVKNGERKIIPFIITADNEELLSAFNLYFECTDANCNLEEDEIRMVVLSALDKGFGYAQTPVGHEKIAEVWDTDILEYIYFEIDGPSEDHHIVLKGKESSR